MFSVPSGSWQSHSTQRMRMSQATKYAMIAVIFFARNEEGSESMVCMVTNSCISGNIPPGKSTDELEGLLRESNLVLKLQHERAKASGFKGSRRLFFSLVVSGDFSNMPKKHRSLILRVKEIEWEVFCHYRKMISKIASRWRTNRLSWDDLESVAHEGFLNAVCCFTDPKIRFSTYLSKCVERHISDFLNNEDVVRKPAEVIRMRSKLSKMMSSGMTMDSAILEMGLSDGDRRILVESMREVGLFGPGELSSVAWRQATEELGILETWKKLEFSGLDKAVFDEFVVMGEDMSLKELSKRAKNPKTGNSYSKRSMGLAWKRVKIRLLDAIENG